MIGRIEWTISGFGIQKDGIGADLKVAEKLLEKQEEEQKDLEGDKKDLQGDIEDYKKKNENLKNYQNSLSSNWFKHT